MKRTKRFICILLSTAMIMSASAVSISAETEVSKSKGNIRDVTAKDVGAMAASDRGSQGSLHSSIVYPKIKINRQTAKIGRDHKLRLKAFLYPVGGGRKIFRWTSSDRGVAKVSADGTVIGVRPGRTNITVSLRSNPEIRTVCKVTVGYAIKYHTRGGRLGRKCPRVYFNERVTLKEAKKKGYAFQGWYTDRARTKRITYIDEDAYRDYTLYARWEEK